MLQGMLNALIHHGKLTVLGPGGLVAVAGSNNLNESLDVVVRLKKRLAGYKIAMDPDRYLGETYMDGDLTLERGTIFDLLDLCCRNLRLYPQACRAYRSRIRRVVRDRIWRISRHAARRNVAHHYDLSASLYRGFLDDDMQYSCGYFGSPDASLEIAQTAKKLHIAAKLLLGDGQKVLDVGCGWGGLAISLAQMADVEVLGITLSREQLEVARGRAAQQGVGDRVTFALQDYRDVRGRFDRVVSVGMLEHVGRRDYGNYFAAISRLVEADGIALVSSTGRMLGPSPTSSWLRRYIFPGGYIPALSEVVPAVEKVGLWLTDVEVLRGHYAETLRQWRQRFDAARQQLPSAYDDRFCRMWEFYLAASEMGFRHWDMMVFQVQLARSGAVVPTTRNYILDGERALAARLAR